MLHSDTDTRTTRLRWSCDRRRHRSRRQVQVKEARQARRLSAQNCAPYTRTATRCHEMQRPGTGRIERPGRGPGDGALRRSVRTHGTKPDEGDPHLRRVTTEPPMGSVRGTGRQARGRARTARTPPRRRAPGTQGICSWKEPLRPPENAPRHSAPPEEQGGRDGRERSEPWQGHVLACSSSRERAAGPRLEPEQGRQQHSIKARLRSGGRGRCRPSARASRAPPRARTPRADVCE